MTLEISDEKRIQLSREPELARALRDSFSEQELRTFSKEQELWRFAARERVSQMDHGGMPPDIYHALREKPFSMGGVTILVHTPGGTIIPTESGGIRMGVDSEDGVEHMSFEDLDAQEWADLLETHVPDDVRDRLGKLLTEPAP